MIYFQNLKSGSNVTSGTSFVTDTCVFVPNKLYFFGFSIRNGASTDPLTPTVTGGNLTWESIGSEALYDDSGASRRKLFLFRALGSGATQGALTADFGAVTHTGMIYTIDEGNNIITSGTNGSGAVGTPATALDATGTVTTVSVTLSAFASTANCSYGVFCNGNDTFTTTAGSGFFKLGDYSEVNANVSGRLTSIFGRGNDTSVDITYSGTAQLGGIAVEVKQGNTNTFNTQPRISVGNGMSRNEGAT